MRGKPLGLARASSLPAPHRLPPRQVDNLIQAMQLAADALGVHKQHVAAGQVRAVPGRPDMHAQCRPDVSSAGAGWRSAALRED